jgi:hypothetical protein
LQAHDFKPDVGVKVKQLGQCERRKSASLTFQLRPWKRIAGKKIPECDSLYGSDRSRRSPCFFGRAGAAGAHCDDRWDILVFEGINALA